MTETNSSVKLRNYECANCKTHYNTNRFIKNKASRFCSDECQAKIHNSRRNVKGKQTRKTKKLESRFAEFHKTAFGIWLLYEIKRSGTLEVLQALKTAEDLLLLYQLWLFKQKCYGWSKEGAKFTSIYELCHISPCKSQDDSRGLLHPNNLFVGSAAMNREQSNKPLPSGVGMKLPGSLQDKWLLPEKISLEALSKKLRKYLGKSFDTFLVDADERLGLTERYRLAKRIYNRQQKNTAKFPLPEHYTKSELEGKEVVELRSMDEHQTGKSTFTPTLYPRPIVEVYCTELERLGESLPEGKHKQLCKTLAPLLRVVHLIEVTEESLLNEHPLSGWKLFNYRYPYTELGRVEHSIEIADRSFVSSSACELGYQTLQGALVEVEWFRKRLMKRFTVNKIQPAMVSMYSTTWVKQHDVKHVEETKVHLSCLVAAGMISQADADAACLALRLEYAQEWQKDVRGWRRKNKFIREVPEWFNRPDLQALLDGQSQDRQEAA